MAKDKEEESAEKQRNWAEDRTILANERTFSAWMGAGMGAVGVAIGLKAVFRAIDPEWAGKSVATMFLLIAIIIFWTSRQQAVETYSRLTETDAEALPKKSFTMLATAMTIATVGVGAVLWAI